jgi:hypothetical protein
MPPGLCAAAIMPRFWQMSVLCCGTLFQTDTWPHSCPGGMIVLELCMTIYDGPACFLNLARFDMPRTWNGAWRHTPAYHQFLTAMKYKSGILFRYFLTKQELQSHTTFSKVTTTISNIVTATPTICNAASFFATILYSVFRLDFCLN